MYQGFGVVSCRNQGADEVEIAFSARALGEFGAVVPRDIFHLQFLFTQPSY